MSRAGSFNDFQNVDRKDAEKVLANAAEIQRKASSGALARFASIIPNLISLVYDYLSGRYPNVPWMTIAAISGALLYVLSPIDACPDFIPIAGLLDDAGVLAAVLAFVECDVNAYLEWKCQQVREN